MYRIIGITGKKRSGKDTVANYLMTEMFRLARPHSKFAFADPLKDMTCKILGINYEQLEKQDKDTFVHELDCSRREIMQKIGTEVVRQIHPDTWVFAMHNRLLKAFHSRRLNGPPGHPVAIITDVRFDNEAKWIRSQGGVILHIRRPETDEAGDTHESEAGVSFNPDVDLIVQNRTTLEHLQIQIEQMAPVILTHIEEQHAHLQRMRGQGEGS